MKKYILLIAPINAASGYGLEVYMSLSELVPQSEVIVVARLTNVRSWRERDTDLGQGTLRVTRSVLGKYAAGDSLVLMWENPAMLACPRNEHRDTKGKSFIWMLQIRDNGEVVTGSDQLVRDVSDEREIDSILRANPVFLKVVKGHSAGSSAVL